MESNRQTGNITFAQVTDTSGESDSVTVSSSLSPVPGSNGYCNPSITCYGCGNRGHLRTFCPTSNATQCTQLTLTSISN